MEVSQATISPKTLDLNRLSKTKKTNLRRKLVIEYIQSKPSGEIIRMAEIQRVGQFTTTPNTNMFVNRMLRDGIITRYKGDKPRTYYYAVTGAVRVKKPANQAEEAQGADKPATVSNNHQLTDYAKQFAWERNSDSLREFVEYMDGKELQLRRLSDTV
jgi:DNA-binding MarR family transcriptional regulator